MIYGSSKHLSRKLITIYYIKLTTIFLGYIRHRKYTIFGTLGFPFELSVPMSSTPAGGIAHEFPELENRIIQQ
jgi:hypothetical protein